MRRFSEWIKLFIIDNVLFFYNVENSSLKWKRLKNGSISFSFTSCIFIYLFGPKTTMEIFQLWPEKFVQSFVYTTNLWCVDIDTEIEYNLSFTNLSSNLIVCSYKHVLKKSCTHFVHATLSLSPSSIQSEGFKGQFITWLTSVSDMIHSMKFNTFEKVEKNELDPLKKEKNQHIEQTDTEMSSLLLLMLQRKWEA